MSTTQTPVCCIFQIFLDIKILSLILSVPIFLRRKEICIENNISQIIWIKVSLEVSIHLKVTDWPLKLPYA